MKRKSTILIGTLIISIVIGFLLSKTTIFTLIWLFIAILILVNLTIIIGIIDYFKKSKNYIYPALFSLFLILTLTSTLAIYKIKDYKNLRTANLLIKEINYFKDTNGHFPNSLSEFENEKYKSYNYWVDSTNQKFELSYILDGWHIKFYNSDNKNWLVKD